MKKYYFLIFLLIANFIFSIMLGKHFFSIPKIISLLVNRDTNNVEYKILTQIRIPRTVATYIVGAGLAVAGCVLQSIFLNPLCESYTLGISSAAALGVVLGLILKLPIGKFLMSTISIIIAFSAIYLLTLIFHKTIDIGFVLTGIVLNYLFSGLIVMLTLFIEPYRLHYVLLWLLGGFSGIDTKEVYLCSLIIAMCIVIILIYSDQLDILVLGKEKSISLGVDEIKLKKILLTLVILISTFCISLSGVIMFVGIIVPNMMKTFVGLKHNRWILFSAITGAVFVSIADNLSRNILYPIEIPISVFTGILGSVFFIFYIKKSKITL